MKAVYVLLTIISLTSFVAGCTTTQAWDDYAQRRETLREALARHPELGYAGIAQDSPI